MQNKTQVFPLPEHIFVHNRLTHSLEVASVGRSLGSLWAEKLQERYPNNPLVPEIGTIVSTACLAHDLGNPPFGHSGEDAISNYFKHGEGKMYRDQLSDAQWKDFTLFDGNANAFRILSHQFKGKRKGGFALTYSTLASIVKYPYEAQYATKPKFGFFQTDKEHYFALAEALGIIRRDEHRYSRHPLVYLVEAADDICYQVMDLEDAYKLGILSYDEIKHLYLNFYHPEQEGGQLSRIEEVLESLGDLNERVSYLRSGVIGKLIYEGIEIFERNEAAILSGTFEGSLMDHLPETRKAAMKTVQNVSVEKVYRNRGVVEIEIAGFKIIGTLINEFLKAMMNPDDSYSKKVKSLIPEQYLPVEEGLYFTIQSVVDFVSGMTDVFALDLYRKIKGISLPGLA